MPHTSDPPKQTTRFESILWILVVLIVIAVPLVFMRPAIDMFRTPKTVFFQTGALLLFALGAGGLLFSGRIPAELSTRRTALLLSAGAVLWTALTSVTSLNPAVSFFKPLSIFSTAVFVLVTIWTCRNRAAWAIGIVIIPAIVNAGIALLQSTSPGLLVLTTKNLDNARLRTTGLIGNPNELGGYFVLPLMASIAAAIVWPRLRWAFGAAALILAGGIVAAQSVTPILAVGAGIVAIAFLPGTQTLRRTAAAVLLLLTLAVALHPGARLRMTTLARDARGGAALDVSSLRLPAFAVALRMFSEHPLLGVGPGVFTARYMPYKLQLDREHPSWIRVGNENFGEVHNDHLQILAETGLPGYCLFLAALGLVARLSFVRRDDTESCGGFVRAFALPGAAAFFVLALAHFPMQLTSTSIPAAYLAAICFAWSEPDEMG